MARQISWTWPELVLAVELRHEVGWLTGSVDADDPRTVALSELLRAANPGLALDQRFRSRNSVRRKVEDLKTQHPDYHGKPTKSGIATKRIVHAFLEDPVHMLGLAEQFRAEPHLVSIEFTDSMQVEYVNLDELDGDGPVSAIEGAVAYRLAAFRERDPKLRQAKIDESMRERGTLACETCGFDFYGTYGELGDGYTHVHHVTPLHVTGPTVTTLDDLVLVCANCHAMVHRRRPWKTPEEIVSIVDGSPYLPD
ncbi:HNH endonuclease [Gordonia phthalatica]|uniref:HNH nuclease domain-containing protein n=1 Tax=Gordonia phthalatica TaxID=1136941 RepID=A0A0N7FUC4_9ACTN|nr:HNH endonuclease [Gordonia phthalatica]ALG83967.1 hypothetical protein ACH46_04870 [Gordonia phthalatica]